MNIQQVIDTRFKGVLSPGKHAENGVACVLEAYSVAKGVPWTDNPSSLGVPDIRPLNDALWSSSELRTTHMVRLVEACEYTTVEKLSRIVLRTIREILPLILPEKEAKACADAKTLEEARSATAATAYASAADYAYAADYASAADYAASATAASASASAASASASAADDILILACNIWVEELLA